MLINGWVSIHRKILDWGYYKDSHALHLFIHLIVNANWQDKDFDGILIHRGQLATSVNSIYLATGLSTQKIRTLLKKLENSKEIIVKSTNKYTIITICKYDTYQPNEDEANKPTTNQQQTNNKRITTIKEGNKDIINNNYISTSKKLEFPNDNDVLKKGQTWRDSFDIYLKEGTDAFSKAYDDELFISVQESIHPNIDVRRTLHNASQYWLSEDAWLHKKSKKATKKINWQQTIKMAVGNKINRVYKPKEFAKAL